MGEPWKFYVYCLVDESGAVQYVGKGSGRRLNVSSAYRGYQGAELARFKREADAYAFEVDRINALKPALNKHKGGNGPRAKKARSGKVSAFDALYKQIGSRAMAARLWLFAARSGLCDLSKVEQIRRVAYGAG